MQLNAQSGTKAEHPTSYSPLPTSSPAQNFSKNKMVGFDAVLARLLDVLIGKPSTRLVVPVVGMGGMGKTTLAKNVYQHSLVEHHFDVRYWATISQEYSAKSVLRQLVPGKQNVHLLGEELHKNLSGRRYLIIFDDMWSVEAWYKIKMYLPDNGNGSRVIVTTRLSNLAINLNSSPFKMEFLDDNQSWELFCGEAFDEGKCPLELERIGRKIVGRCKGLPLSIIVIAGHLRKSSRAFEYWEKVSRFMNPISSSEKRDKCMKIISLSYHHLPIHLKPCFLCMGKFKEDEEINVANLLSFWVAEGLIKPKEGDMSLEEVAEDCLNDLIDRNLVIVRQRRWNEKPEYCGIHDIVREFCLKVGKKERFLGVVNTKEGESGDRAIVIMDWKHNSGKWLSEFRSLRVPECVERHISEENLHWLATSFQRVNLHYLEYRAISWTICNLPSSISRLWNLQTLILEFNVRTSAPQEIWEMTQLRHLNIFQLYLPDPLQECIVLRNLHTLGTTLNLRLTKEVCERMPNIKVLSLCYSNSFSDWCPQNLYLFNKLESLTLRFCGHALTKLPLPSPLSLPSSVQELDLEVPGLHWEDLRTMIKFSPHLGFLRLSSIEGQDWILVDEEFPSLKYLSIHNCDDLIYWNANSSHFPRLQSLSLWQVSKLSEIPFGIGDIPSLSHITLFGCNECAAVSAMRILVEQERYGNQDLHLHVNFDTVEQVDRFRRMLQEKDFQSERLRISCQRSEPFKLSQFSKRSWISKPDFESRESYLSRSIPESNALNTRIKRRFVRFRSGGGRRLGEI